MPSKILPGSDFGEPDEPRMRTINEVMGDEKTGKSSFWMSAPGPILVFDFDRRLERVVQKAIAAGKQIEVMPFRAPRQSKREDSKAKADADKMWRRIIDNYERALDASDKGKVRTIVVDTWTELYTTRVVKEFGRTSGFRSRERGPINLDLTDFLREAEQHSANLIVVSQMTDEYVGDESTGKRKRKGFNQTGSIVQQTFQTRWNQKTRKFEVVCLLSGINSALNGKVWTQDDFETFGAFPTIMSEAVEESTIMDWMDED